MSPLKLAVCLVLALVMSACGGQPPPPPGSGDNPPPVDNPPPTNPDTCAVVISGDITIPTRLDKTPNTCDYFVRGGTIRVRSELAIDPGVVQFEQDTRLMIDDAGSITAVGTPEARIRLEGQLAVKGSWYGLCFGTNRASRLEYVDILWAGKVWSGGSTACRAAIGGVSGNGEPVSVKHSLIAGAYTSGLDATRVPLGDFENNVFADNTEYGVLVSPENVHKLDAASDYLGASVGRPNGKPYVFFSGFLKGDGSSVTWRKLNAPYYTGDEFPYGRNVIVDEPITMTIEPGTRFEFGPDRSLNFWDGASLNAIGTPEAPIVFTGKSQVAGSWEGLSFGEAGSSTLENVEVSYGGADGLFAGNIAVYGVYATALVTIRNSLITYSETCGILVSADVVEQSGNTFQNNAYGDVCD